MLKDATFNVSTFFECDTIEEYKERYQHDPVWRQTNLGCLVLLILQSMYHFNISYVNVNVSEDDMEHLSWHNTVDIFVRPMSVLDEYLDYAYPVHSIFQWRFGFLLRYKEEKIIDTFYSLPFTSRVWSCVIFILFLSSLVFYILSYWEKRIMGGECQYHHELLLAFSAYCQHILPLQANLYSRRIAYLIFILCAYVVHCYYTSNLLSHLVNDNDRDMDLRDLATSEYDIVIIKDMNLITEKRIQQVSLDKNFTIVESKLLNVKIMNVSSALEAVRDTKTAVLSDYTSLYPIVKTMFDNNALCDLIEVDLYSAVKKYFFTSKRFPFKEEFKVGIMRAKEVGLIKRMLALKTQQPFSCNDNTSPEAPGFKYTLVPFAILLTSFLLSLFIMFGEIILSKNQVFPYVD